MRLINRTVEALAVVAVELQAWNLWLLGIRAK